MPSPEHSVQSPGEEEEPTFSAWFLVWTIVVAKAGTLLLVLWAAHDFETGILLAATSWFWLPLIVALCASPVLFRIRLRRVRAKREALRRAEWMIDSVNLRAPTARQSARSPVIPSEVEESRADHRGGYLGQILRLRSG